MVHIRKKKMPNSANFRRELRIFLLEQVGFQNTLPEVPIAFRVSRGNPESQLRTSLGLGILKGWLGTWDASELLTVLGS